jgi:hypothetical protein
MKNQSNARRSGVNHNTGVNRPHPDSVLLTQDKLRKSQKGKEAKPSQSENEWGHIYHRRSKAPMHVAVLMGYKTILVYCHC